MKGIAHFTTGVATASCFPVAVQAAMDGNPLYFVLGGVFGLMPDTLDFKFYRFFYRHDLYIDPDPEAPDPQAIAEQLAAALDQAQREGREVRVKLNTIRVGGDLWRQYRVRFDNESQQVEVEFGPVVNTGQVPVPGSEPEQPLRGSAKLETRFFYNYDSVTTVDIFDGPSFAFVPEAAAGRVVIEFLPWHRGWSHSLLTGAGFGVLGAMIWGWPAGLIMALAFSAHVLEDQLGHLGSALFWPLYRRRFRGIGRMHASDALPNFLAVWLSMILVFWNSYRVALDPVYYFSLGQLLLFGVVAPLALFSFVHWTLKRGRGDRRKGEVESSDEWVEGMGT
jgi:membrane-bound metal-dependent hydrolase YbcI (DUF457 family)